MRRTSCTFLRHRQAPHGVRIAHSLASAQSALAPADQQRRSKARILQHGWSHVGDSSTARCPLREMLERTALKKAWRAMYVGSAGMG